MISSIKRTGVSAARRGAVKHRMLTAAQPGFALSRECRRAYCEAGGVMSPGLCGMVKRELAERSGAAFGDPENPLLFALHCGRRGIILNLGLNDASIPAVIRLRDECFAFDCHRSLIHTYGHLVGGIPQEVFAESLNALKRTRGIVNDLEMTDDDWEECVRRYQMIYHQHTGEAFPQNPDAQLAGALEAALRDGLELS